MLNAAVLSLQPVDTTRSRPVPSRYFAAYVGDAASIPLPSFVSGAEAVLPFDFHFATFPAIVASLGIGRAYLFLYTVPIARLPLGVELACNRQRSTFRVLLATSASIGRSTAGSA